MRLIELFLKVNTKEVKDAGKETEELGKKAKKAEKDVKTLSGAFKEFSGVGGIIGDIAGRFEDVKDKVAAAGGGMRTLAAAVGGVGTAAAVALPALVALAGAAGILGAFRLVGPLGDLNDLTQKLGKSATELALLKQNLEGAGTSLQAYEQSQNKLAKALAESVDQNSKQYEAIRRLTGEAETATTVQELQTRVLDSYNEKLKEGTLTATDMADLQTLLGENYKESIFAINEAAKAQERFNSFSKAGVGISKAGTDAADAYGDAMDDAAFVLQSFGSKLVAEIIPAFTGLINALVDSYKNGGLVRIAFDGIRVASQLLMIPIRALFNVFIQLDAAVQSVGKSIGAMFAAISTGNLNPIRALREDLKNLWETANSRTTSPWSWDTGESAPTPTLPSPSTGQGTRKTKPEKDQAWEDEKKRIVEMFKLSAEQTRQQEEADKKAEEAAERKQDALNRLLQKYREMVDPLARFYDEQFELMKLMQMYPEHADLFTKAWEKIDEQIKKAKESTKDTKKDIDVLSRIGETAFQGLEDSLMSLVTTGRFSFKNFIASILQDIARLIIQLKVIQPMLEAFKNWNAGTSSGGFWSTIVGAFLPSANGNVFDKGPVMHGFNGGMGVLGEAGPEAVLPLKRTATGKLGVIAQGATGGSGVNVGSINVTVQGGQTNAETGQAVSKAVVEAMKRVAQGEIANARRPGGLLYA